MKKGIRLLIYMLLTLTIMVTSGGCYDRREIDDLTYVIALGLDKGTTDALRLTLQYSIPRGTGSGASEGEEGGGSKSLGLITLEASSLYAGLNMANGFIGKQINTSHANALIISEVLAKEDISQYFRAIVRGREFRPNMYVAVCRGSAEDYLRSIKPQQEIDPSKYYELIFNTYKFTGFTVNSQLYKFHEQMNSLDSQPVAILADVSRYNSTSEFVENQSASKESDRQPHRDMYLLAGEIPKVGDLKAEVMGMAVFRESRMVGKLDGESATNYLMLTGDYKYSYLTLPDPMFPGKYVILNISQSRKPERYVDLSGDRPVITVKVHLEGDFVSIQSGYNYESLENVPIIEQAVSKYYINELTKFLTLTAKEFDSDICGFGREAKTKFLTWKEWVEYNWPAHYKDCVFNVDVNVKIRRPGLLIRTARIESTLKGELP